MSIKDALAAMIRVAKGGVPLSQRYVNLNAPAITDDDIKAASSALGVTPAHIRMVRKVESGGKSFDPQGRPVILFEPHVFHRLTNGKYSPTSYSYAKWKTAPYPASPEGKWKQMSDAATRDLDAALESASWGLFQIMGFHWEALGYASPQDFAAAMTESEGNQLEAVVRFIKANKLVDALRSCRPGNPESCRAFARGYNGTGYEQNKYHIKLAQALEAYQ